MTQTFSVHQIILNPDRFELGGAAVYVEGILLINADETTLYDSQTEDQLPLEPAGTWREWLPQEISPLRGDELYFDQAIVVGEVHVKGGEVRWIRVWQVRVLREGRWLESQEHPELLPYPYPRGG